MSDNLQVRIEDVRRGVNSVEVGHAFTQWEAKNRFFRAIVSFLDGICV